MSERKRPSFLQPPSYFNPEDVLMTPAQVRARMKRLYGQALRVYKQHGGDLGPNSPLLPRPGSYLIPEVAGWRYRFGNRVLRGAEGFLAEYLEPSNFFSGSISATPEISLTMFSPGAPVSEKVLQAIVHKTRVLLEAGGETITAIVPTGIKGKGHSFYFRESLADQQERAGELRTQGIQTSGKVLYVMPDRRHPEWNFKGSSESSAIGLMAKLLVGLTVTSMPRDELIRYLWNLKAEADVRPFVKALGSQVRRANRFLDISDLEVVSKELRRGYRGIKRPFEYSIGPKPVREKELGSVSATAGSVELVVGSVVVPAVEAVGSESWPEIAAILDRSPGGVSDRNIRKLATIFGLDPAGNHLRIRVGGFVGAAVFRGTRGLSYPARFDAFTEARRKVKGLVISPVQAAEVTLPALPRPVVEKETVQLPDDLEIACVIVAVSESLPDKLKAEVIGDFGVASALLREMPEGERSEFLNKAREKLYQSLDSYQVGRLLQHHQRNEVYWKLIIWAHQNRGLFSGQV